MHHVSLFLTPRVFIPQSPSEVQTVTELIAFTDIVQIEIGLTETNATV